MALTVLTIGMACREPAGTRYAITGQVVAVLADRGEVVIRHDAIPGFMPAMTMPFKVEEQGLLRGRSPGDLVRGILVVRETSAYLADLEKVGFQPVGVGAPEHGLRGEPLPRGAAVPDVSLTDQAGSPRKLSEWRGRAVALTFIFTRCPLPEFCPAMDRRFRELQSSVKADQTLRGRVVLLSISFDPEFDTPAVLTGHAARAGADPSMWLFLTGPEADVETLGSWFGLQVVREGDGTAGLTHNLRTAVIDAQGRLVRIHRGADWTTGDVLADIRGGL
jgi:protein SCO1/2